MKPIDFFENESTEEGDRIFENYIIPISAILLLSGILGLLYLVLSNHK